MGLDKDLMTNRRSEAPKLELLRKPLPELNFSYSEKQSEVISHSGKNPLIVLGGPGTGKTQTLIAQALAKIDAGIDPNSILILTFGRDRADYLRDEISLRSPKTANEPLARTFHALAFSIVRMATPEDKPDPILFSGSEQDSYIKQMLLTDSADNLSGWPDELKAALPTRGFAKELRDVLLRATERGLYPEKLSEYAKTYSENYWSPIAKFWDRYIKSLAMREEGAADAKERIDPSGLIIAAMLRLQDNPNLLSDLRAKYSVIMVDEFQESDISHRLLLSYLSSEDFTIFADPDSTVGRFRGADPEGLKSYFNTLKEKGADEVLLLENYRSSEAIVELTKSVAMKFRGRNSVRDVTALRKDEGPEVIVLRLQSQADEASYIAHAFRSAHLHNGVPWSEMAVIVRSPGPAVAAIRRALSLSGVPTRVDTDVFSLADNPVVKPFLTLAEIALGAIEINAENYPIMEELLFSEIGGADPISLRRIRQELSRSRDESDLRSATELILDAITDPIISIPWENAAPIKRINDLLRRAKTLLRKHPKLSISDLLWEIWSNAENIEGEKISKVWRSSALRGGSRGGQADRDLDTMLELFESARRYVERFPNSKPAEYINQIRGEDILGDTITLQGQKAELVAILTVHSAKGREWEIVALAGMQDGIWPNLKARGSLLGSDRLVEALRSQSISRAELDESANQALLEDERRLLHVAVSRPKKSLFITAISREDDEPSRFFEELSELVNGEIDGEPLVTQIPRPLTSSALVATLRRTLISEFSSAPDRELAAAILATLAKENISSANPENWLGYLAPSIDKPLIEPGDPVYVSPSSIQNFTECGLKWFLERNGSRDGDSTAQILGSALHAFAALLHTNPELTPDELKTRLNDSWSLIDMNKGWVKDRELARATDMLEKFFTWHFASDRKLLAVEKEFSVTVGNAIIKGSVDRIEITDSNEIVIVDLKTGKTATSAKDTVDHKQLQAYQLAVIEGAFTELNPNTTSGGAELLFVGNNAKSASVRSQEPIDGEVFKAEVAEVAIGMSGSRFRATINDQCDRCQVRKSCPIQSHGRTVVEQ